MSLIYNFRYITSFHAALSSTKVFLYSYLAKRIHQDSGLSLVITKEKEFECGFGMKRLACGPIPIDPVSCQDLSIVCMSLTLVSYGHPWHR